MYFPYFFWLTIVIFTNYITYKRKIINKSNPLNDICHSNLVNLSKYKYICDLFPFINIWLVNNYRTYLFNHAILVILRFICFHSTILPSPMDLKLRFSFYIIPNFTYDLIFSGHTMTCILAIYFTDYVYICIINSILCSISVILTKEHYTIDVIIAWLASYVITSIVNKYSINQ